MIRYLTKRMVWVCASRILESFKLMHPTYCVFTDMNCDQLRVDTLILKKQDEWWVIKILCRRCAGSRWIKRTGKVVEVVRILQERRRPELVSYPLR